MLNLQDPLLNITIGEIITSSKDKTNTLYRLANGIYKELVKHREKLQKQQNKV